MYFGTFCDTKILFAWIVKPTWLQNVLQSLLDPQALRNQKSINPILRICNLKEVRFENFCYFFRENGKNQAKILQSCFLKIANSQDWVDGFSISQSLWVKVACEHILRQSRFHKSCKKSFWVIKTPKIHLYYQFHIWVTVCRKEW